MALPFAYHFRNLFVRWRATLATVLGIALVVTVYLLVQSLALGLERASDSTGDPRNYLVVRRGSVSESGSQIPRQVYHSVKYLPEIARDAAGEPLISADTVLVLTLARADGMGEANLTLRGVSPAGLELRPQVRLVAGRWFEPGRREVVVSRNMAARFANMKVGERFTVGSRELAVVGWFEGGGSAFDSEMWMAADEARSTFSRESYSSLLVRPVEGLSEAELAQIVQRLESDKRFGVRLIEETTYYAEQTKTAKPIRVLGNFLATVMSVGAIFAAMNTLYASVGARTREVGTLRVLGFPRRMILAGFLLEGALLATLGGALGCLLALPMNGYTTGTISFDTFSETVFQFTLTPALLWQGMVFAIGVGVLGSLLPAWRASRLPVIAALKSI